MRCSGVSEVIEEAPGGLSCLTDRVGGMERGNGGREACVYFRLKGGGLASVFQTILPDSGDFLRHIILT